ncbi:hypothetical protein ACIOWI_01680 [Streptomyces sp. NPDC087659]|uniref:hypothetical protein n=1 Tax=Streptomyces sp. NPDC087659 TaxID=3365801 RepID=UPI0037F40485
MGDEFGDAMEQLWGVTSELTGLTELEACLDNKDFEHCSSLAADVLIGAKLKALEKAYDGLKLLKRGCEVAGKAGMRTMSARSADVPCLTHNVPGLPRDKSKIPDSTDCGACAKRIRDSLGGGEIVTIKPAGQHGLGGYRGQDTFWFEHIVVVYKGRVYDGFTGRGGETIAEYKAKWDWPDAINFGF